MSVPAPSGAPDPATCRVVLVTPLSGSAGMEVAAAPNLGCISNRVAIPFSSTLVTATVTPMVSAAPSRIRRGYTHGVVGLGFLVQRTFGRPNWPVGPTMPKDAASIPPRGWVSVSPSRSVRWTRAPMFIPAPVFSGTDRLAWYPEEVGGLFVGPGPLARWTVTLEAPTTG